MSHNRGDHSERWTAAPLWAGAYPDPGLCEDGFEPEAGVVARGDGGRCRCGRATPWRERASGNPVCSAGCREAEDVAASLPAWEPPPIDDGLWPWE